MCSQVTECGIPPSSPSSRSLYRMWISFPASVKHLLILDSLAGHCFLHVSCVSILLPMGMCVPRVWGHAYHVDSTTVHITVI